MEPLYDVFRINPWATKLVFQGTQIEARKEFDRRCKMDKRCRYVFVMTEHESK